MGSTKITKTIDEKLLFKKHENIHIIDTRFFIPNYEKISVFCDIHEVLFYPTIKNLLNGHGCKKCGYETNLDWKKYKLSYYLDYDSFEYICVDNNRRLTLSDVNKCIPAKSKITAICKKHNETFTTNLGSHKQSKGGGCQTCRYEYSKKNNPLRKYNDIEEIKSLIKDSYLYEFEFVDNKYVKILCKKCNTWNEKKIEVLKRNEELGSGCTKCSQKRAGINRRYAESEFKLLMDSKNLSYHVFNNKWLGVKTKIMLKCDTHGIYEKTVSEILYDRIQDKRLDDYCQTCNLFFSGVSSGEQELYEFISKIVYCEQSNRTVLDGKEIDILLPEHKIGIEFNGMYYHSSKRKDKNYHLNKLEQCDKNGIRLLQFWEIEWTQKKDIVKSIILSSINKFEMVVYARKTIKRILTFKPREFYDKNHIQGFRGGAKHIGLFHENELVSCMTIGSDGEIVRFCSKLNTKVIGGFSKLLKDSGALYSFVDRRLFNGNSYSNTDFNFVYNTAINYSYYKNKIMLSRIGFQKHKLKDKLKVFDENLTEFENMKNNGYLQMYDCGNMKFVKS